MTDDIIKKMLQNFNLDSLTTYERFTYNKYIAKLPKYLSLYKLMVTKDNLSEELQEIKDFENYYKSTIKY